MTSSTREEIVEVLGVLDVGLDRLCDLSFDALTTPERLRVLERVETVARRLRIPRHALINQLGEQASEEELGGKLATALANRLRISRTDANRRIAEAADLGERRALTGETLPPQLTATAQAQREGRLGDEHVAVIRRFFRRLPVGVDPLTRQAAEADVAHKATQFRPDELSKYAEVLLDCLNPDGSFTDEDRARCRGIVIGRQEFDGMSRISGYLNPEMRATLDAVLAKLAAPGMCNPDDEAPVVDEDPSDETRRRDSRSDAQRNHDGLLAGLRALLMSGKLGRHNEIPTSIVVTTTLDDLEAAVGCGLTAGGSRLPMSDLIRMAGHARHYLAAGLPDDRGISARHGLLGQCDRRTVDRLDRQAGRPRQPTADAATSTARRCHQGTAPSRPVQTGRPPHRSHRAAVQALPTATNTTPRHPSRHTTRDRPTTHRHVRPPHHFRSQPPTPPSPPNPVPTHPERHGPSC